TGARGGDRVAHHASFVIAGVKADAMLMELDLRGIAASSGSACGALTGEPSHVLRAIGCDTASAEGSLCFTAGRWTTANEIDAVVQALPAVVTRLRRLAPRGSADVRLFLFDIDGTLVTARAAGRQDFIVT